MLLLVVVLWYPEIVLYLMDPLLLYPAPPAPGYLLGYTSGGPPEEYLICLLLEPLYPYPWSLYLFLILCKNISTLGQKYLGDEPVGSSWQLQLCSWQTTGTSIATIHCHYVLPEPRQLPAPLPPSVNTPHTLDISCRIVTWWKIEDGRSNIILLWPWQNSNIMYYWISGPPFHNPHTL